MYRVHISAFFDVDIPLGTSLFIHFDDKTIIIILYISKYFTTSIANIYHRVAHFTFLLRAFPRSIYLISTNM